MPRFLVMVAVLLPLAPLSAQQKAHIVEEEHPSGRLAARYRVDAEGRKDGVYTSWHENGRVWMKGAWRKGVRAGVFEEFYESGGLRTRKRFVKGALTTLERRDRKGRVLHRASVKGGAVLVYPPGSKKGLPAHPRARETLISELLRIDPPVPEARPADKYAEPYSLEAPFKAGRLRKDYLESALRRARAHRYLAGLGDALQLDDAMCRASQHAAVVCALNGRISHHPKLPSGLPRPFYDLGHKGASSSNLSMGHLDLRGAVDGWMDDSDPSNINRVGHRSWLLNPRAGRIGFGEVEGFQAQWSMDSSARGKRPRMIAYPAPGWFPASYFNPRVAWSAAFDPARYRIPRGSRPRVTLWTLDADWDLEQELKLDYAAWSTIASGMGRAVIFRPVLPPKLPLAGLRVLVSIAGFKQPRRDPPILYVVEFFDLPRR